jgi:hypothetical protein
VLPSEIHHLVNAGSVILADETESLFRAAALHDVLAAEPAGGISIDEQAKHPGYVSRVSFQVYCQVRIFIRQFAGVDLDPSPKQAWANPVAKVYW